MFETVDKDGATRPWNGDSYRKAWANLLHEAVKTHPELRGMILRDLRKVFRTRLTDAKVAEHRIRKLTA